ncbi:MAG: multifunctional oxoglutarate decarboxylase/oxoglutarate dehydrogenase thiamine pyrophosphate-binding subunit/dihydrolipoyllysine-residue succinyltransferase subunit [Gemmatimonadetes bacterium]|nr:MAG: multifunctional oxoglutarate decarboxylase/oxoglutarate dehydrogenase thiamine pyrophosphate-binding subunit/dihydrolipoyllysine-residue succinyltransferase subunit [Gemmatimonadota bacterium]
MAQKGEALPFSGANSWLIEEMYRQFQENPNAVDENWREFFSTNGKSFGKPKPPLADTTSASQKSSSDDLPPGAKPLKGGAVRIVENMERSLSIPTATSTRVIPVRLLEENRRIINRYQVAHNQPKISFTHVIAWAILKALKQVPAMTYAFTEVAGKMYRIEPAQINFGLAVDVERKGGRTLLVPNIKAADRKSFREFVVAYNELIQKVRNNTISPDDFSGTTLTLTNTGTIGTYHSAPRLMVGQGLIVATGAIDYPAEYQSADLQTLARLGVSKVMTISSTYDHRVIQGAESGQFLRFVHLYLNGDYDFYDDIFESLKIPFKPLKLTRDINPMLEGTDEIIEKSVKVYQLINMYRVRGHLIANLDPIRSEVPSHVELDPEYYQLSVWDYDRTFHVAGLAGKNKATLRDVLDILRDAYCQTIGIEYMHIQDPVQKQWIQNRVEGIDINKLFNHAKRMRILNRLNAAEAFEQFLQTKYIGHKRFSAEGAETIIPMLDALFDRAIETHRIVEAVIGMAHRGRLNVLANIMEKPYAKIFREFEGDIDPSLPQGSGDVKYHLGAKGVHHHRDGRGTLEVTLSANPSHLEAVDPVAEGMTRAKQDMRTVAGHRTNRKIVLPVLVHGDSAFAGQGVVAETFNLSALLGYHTGGTIHIVINNGIGFTTGPKDSRSSVYATDVAKMVQAPIFHVNANDPEACIRVIELALDFRQEFGKDVVIDLLCYRRYGHNESDEPSYTQPKMYSKIRQMPSIREIYMEQLVKRHNIKPEEIQKVTNEFKQILGDAFEETQKVEPQPVSVPQEETPPEQLDPEIETGVARPILDEISRALSTVPEGFTIHPKLIRLLKNRSEMLAKDAVDWAMGELLAFGSLVLEGTPVRLSGQDSRRGTFSQRHAILIDYETEEIYNPLNHIIPGKQSVFMPYDSSLSEYAVMGFEYGYAMVRENSLTIWEAQFGDFMNGAQIIIDQFISSSEDKWGQTSGLVLMLPHGYEGQGPEHSSARIERFLTLCAESNMRIIVPTTAAQHFHALRRQAHLAVKRPQVIFTPKSLLRAPDAKSTAAEFTNGRFKLVLDDPNPPENPTRILFCTGKIAYELLHYREENKITDTAIVRLEQLYPFPHKYVQSIFRKYPQASDIRWVQEEPRNMGAWTYIFSKFYGHNVQKDKVLWDYHTLKYVGRLPSGSPASGSHRVHEVEQRRVVEEAFA